MGNLPTLKVLLDDGAGTFPYNITAYVLATDGYQISRGRDDWQAEVTAGELSLTLNNSDGRFTPGSTLIASPTPIVVDRRIRLQEIVNGVTYTRFTGYVKSWPVGWPETVATFSKVQLTATDAQARAERRPLRAVMIEEIVLDNPIAYYTLAEAAGATSAGDTSGNQNPPMTATAGPTPVVFGVAADPLDGLTAAQFNALGQQLQTLPPASFSPSSWSLEVFVATSVVPALPGAAVAFITTGAELFINNLGQIQYLGTSGSITGPVITDGVRHQIAVTHDAHNANLYVDGALIFGSPVADTLVGAAGFFTVGGFTGTLSHVALYGTTLSAGRVASHASARTGFIGESGAARITRLAGYAGILVGALDPSLTNMSAASTDESSDWAQIQAAVDAELGVAFIDGSGSVAFHNRNEVVGKTVPDLTLTSQQITPDVAPVLDDQRLVNYMEVTAEGTGGTGLARNTTSDGTHGRYSGSRSFTVRTDAEALDRANWLVADLAEPVIRYGTLTINLFNMSPAQASTVVAALEIDCWLRVTSMAPQNPGGTTADVIVQGWQETVAAETWAITCNVVSQSLFAPVWIFDSSVFDTTTRFYV